MKKNHSVDSKGGKTPRDKRNISLSLPHLLAGGVSENWLLKEMGDLHWTMISDCLGVSTTRIANSEGNRLNAAFVRLQWQADASLYAFKENEELVMKGDLSLYGNKMFLSDQQISCGNKSIKASLVSVFSSKGPAGNNELKQSAPQSIDTADVFRHRKMPAFAKEYIATKGFFSNPPDDATGKDRKISFGGASFSLVEKPLFTLKYLVDHYDDINGVGLLYFASYSRINDKCEFHYFKDRIVDDGTGCSWAAASSCIARDIFYFGNADSGEELLYSLEEYSFIGDDKIQLTSSLYREKDNSLIAKIFTIKQLLYPITLASSTNDSGEKSSINIALPEAVNLNSVSSAIAADAVVIKHAYNRESLNSIVAGFLGATFDQDDLDSNTDLRELGIESIVYISLAEHLQEKYSIHSNPSRFFGLCTIDAITSYLLKEAAPVGSETTPEKIYFQNTDDDVAIVGASLRVPGADNMAAFWDLLLSGRSAISQTAPDRWTWPAWIDVAGKHKGIDQGGYVRDIDKFDALFFGISPREAELMDPQQRILLELTWELMESAGYKPSSLRDSKTGVFIGVSGSDYELLLKKDQRADTVTATGTAVALLANRISYYYGLEGPSMSIDTACSSSLVAFNEALNAISRKQCKAAIVGGVHVMCDPSRSLAYYHSNMLSVNGKCHTFDNRANGYVRGEGAILLLLKPLADAISDKDTILGVVKGSSVNHGGHSGGLTVPNPHQQQQLVEEAWKKAKVPISTAGYIEAHGTGTSLGDPIEVTGLTAAFQNLKSKSERSLKNWCALGSVKTNIGHLEAASGIAGVLKVLLAMKHRYLPATINFNELNAKLELSGSPFFIQNKPGPWMPVGNANVLRAGISSFGIGGANAHLVLESYEQDHIEYKGQVPAPPYLFVLSARNRERLKAYTNVVIKYIDETPSLNAFQLSCALQTGREELEERLAVVCADITAFREELEKYRNDLSSPLLYTGTVRPGRNTAELPADGKRLSGEWLKNRDLHQLGRYWCAGLQIEWDIPGDNKRSVLQDLPSYPFARQRYWVSSTQEERFTPAAAPLHPMLHTWSEGEPFKSIFTGSEFFLSDHIVNGAKVLPGVAQLELAYKSGSMFTKETVTRMKDVTWLSPLAVAEKSVEVLTEINPLKEGWGYEIKTQNETFSQGKLLTQPLPASADYDLVAIQQTLTRNRSADECYKLFKEMGLAYGQRFQGIKSIRYNEEAALSRITLQGEPSFMLPPGLLDSAVQTCIVLMFGGEKPLLLLPFSVREVNIYDKLPEAVWCYARRSKINKADSKIINYDFDLLNDEGKVLLNFRDLALLPLNTGSHENIADDNVMKVHLFNYEWSATVQDNNRKAGGEHLVLLAGGTVELSGLLKEKIEAEVETIEGNTEADSFLYVLERIKERMVFSKHVIITLLCEHSAYHHYGFLSGLFKTAHLEDQRIAGKVIAVDSLQVNKLNELVNILEAELDNEDVEVRYIGKCREIKQSRSLAIQPIINEVNALKQAGVYLITGGGGGLGRLFASHIHKTSGTKIILVGRSQLSRAQSDLISSLQGGEYYQCDISDRAAVITLIGYIKEKYGRLNGIVHSAGVLQDSIIARKTSQEVQAVFAAKVAGARHLDEATREIELDFMVLFSSVTGILGNPGQADYAAANCWLNNFAAYRNEQCLNGRRFGKTISIVWPLWKEGGMNVNGDTLQRLYKQWSMSPLPAEQGTVAFDSLLNSSYTVPVVTFGDEQKISKKLQVAIGSDTTSPLPDIPAGINSDAVRKYISAEIAKLVSRVTKLDIGYIMMDEELGDYGFDSILYTQLSNELNETFNLELMPTVFYNYPTVEKLSEHLVEEYPSRLLKSIPGSVIAEPKEIESLENVATVSSISKEATVDPAALSAVTSKPANEEVQVAIVGISARFPGSPDVNTFWQNIRDNKDLITEIPADRWNWKDYYGDPYLDERKTKAKWGGFIDDIDKFDPSFFGISSREALLMDPQQRIVLEAVYHALEDAGIPVGDVKGSNTGVFVGVSTADYSLLLSRQQGFINQAQYATGAFYSIIANRISYLFDLHGPSEPIDTACSSSLVAVHRAAENIRSGRCSMAIAAGVNALLLPDIVLSFSQAGMLSEDGRCKAFDQRANGYVRSEGVAAVILKELSKAEADGDHIYGIVKGTAENHGGKANTLTSPNPNAQKEVVLAAWRTANIDPADISYIEAHGTGTSLGDPIEIEGLKRAFRDMYIEKGITFSGDPHCGIGSVKTNIGHLEAAAGMAGLIKVLLSLKYATLPGNVHLKEPNEYLKLGGTPLYLQRESTAWTSRFNKPRLAGISSFGFGGANAHILIQEYIPPVTVSNSSSWQAIVLLSAKNKSRLKDQVADLKNYLRYNDAVNVYDISYTLQVGRTPLEERLAFLANDSAELETRLDAWLEGKTDIAFSGNTRKAENDFLFEGEAGEAYIKTAVAKKQTKALAQLWVRGIDLDWNLLYSTGHRPKKISLPVYPFARERYWPTVQKIDQPEAKAEALPVVITGKSHSLIDFIREETGRLTMMDPQQLDVDEFISDYGVSSIQINHLTAAINNKYGLSIRAVNLQSCLSIMEIVAVVSEQFNGMPAIEVEHKRVIEEPPVPNNSSVSKRDVAIIGMDLEITGAGSLAELKQLLENDKYEVSEFPASRWEALPECYTKGLDRKSFKGRFLDNMPGFDNKLFQISAREAMLMDPQQRLLLHSVWRAIENAGYTRSSFCQRRTAVIVAINGVDYADIVKHDYLVDEFSGRGVKRYISANRISAFFNLKGLSETIDTACSSFFAGIKKALDAIRSGECEQAVICGVQANLLPFTFLEQQAQGILTDEERTLPFDANAKGYVRSEGVSCIVIKGQAAAEEDKDNIVAWIKGAGVAHGGRGLNLTSPNTRSHKQAFLEALDDAQVEINKLVAIEAHGTGMPLGDASELKAFEEVFTEKGRRKDVPCIIGAAKSILGHLEAASGALAIMKSVAALQDGKITGIQALTQVDPSYLSEYFSISPNHQPVPEDADGIIGLHSYGIGGVSSFVMLKKPESKPVEITGSVKQIFILSAQSEYVLRQYANDIRLYLTQIESSPAFNFEHFLASYQVNRESMPVRLAIVTNSAFDLISKLVCFDDRLTITDIYISGVQQQPIPGSVENELHQLAETWLNGGVVNWNITTMSKFPYPHYPMDKRKQFWIIKEKTGSGNLKNGSPEIATTVEDTQFLMLDI